MRGRRWPNGWGLLEIDSSSADRLRRFRSVVSTASCCLDCLEIVLVHADVVVLEGGFSHRQRVFIVGLESACSLGHYLKLLHCIGLSQ